MTRKIRPAAIEQPEVPDIILPQQFSAAGSALAVPERRLRLAILEDALRYYRQYFGASERRARVLCEDAADWFASPDRSEPFSFENVCDALGLDPHYLRRGLQRWRETTLARNTGARLSVVRATVGRERPGDDGSGGSHQRAA